MDIYSDINLQAHNQKLIAAKKVEKWAKTGLLEGLKGERKRSMARLLENQAMQLVSEQRLLSEASDTGDIRGFQAIAFPLVRRVFGNLLAQEITSVQPMAMPAGLIFWLDFTYGTAKAGTTKDDWTAGGSVYGNPLAPLTGGANATGGHYYLQDSYSQFEATGTVGIQSSASVTAWSEVDYDPELSAAVAVGQLFKVVVDLDEDAAITNIDERSYQSFAISGTQNSLLGAGDNAYFRRHNRYDSTNKQLTVYYSGSQRFNSGSSTKVSYVKKTSFTANSDGSTSLTPAFEYAFDNSNSIPEIDIKVVSHEVRAQSRKLKVRWTPELAQDLNSYHAVDAESELTQILADSLALDIDNSILRDMVNNARGATLYWDRRPGFWVNPETGAPTTGPTSVTGTPQQWYQGLFETIQDVSARIQTKTLRYAANYIVCHPRVAALLKSVQEYRPMMDFAEPATTKFGVGVEKAGTLAGTLTVYVSPTFLVNTVLVGYKGDSWLSTSYVYSPYIPLIVTPTVYQYDNLTPTKGVMQRSAQQVVRGDLLGKVVIKGMNELF